MSGRSPCLTTWRSSRSARGWSVPPLGGPSSQAIRGTFLSGAGHERVRTGAAREQGSPAPSEETRMSDRGHSEYDVLTQTGPGTPGGNLMRRFWHPVALIEELPVGGPPVSLKLFGEELVLFRDDEGKPGLLGLHCPHRGADLSYGRVEDGGLRCIYHGWLLDRAGRCLEQPGEPPLFPNYEFLTVPDENVFAIKLHHECNWLQGNEGNIDLLHLSFVHHNALRDLSGPGGAGAPLGGGGAAPHREKVEAELTDYGLKVCKVRDCGDQQNFYLCTYIYPAAFAFSSETQNRGYSVNWHVPIDDTHHWKFTFMHSREQSLDKDRARRSRLPMDDQYRPLRNKANRYQQDRESMKTETYSGIGLVFQAQDLCVTESAPIQDRSREHLTIQDAPLVASRKLLLKGIRDVAEGRDPPGVIRDPARNSFPRPFAHTLFEPNGADWKEWIRQIEAEIGATNPSQIPATIA